MENLLSPLNITMILMVLFSAFFVFLFNYRADNEHKYGGKWYMVLFDLFINMGMSVTGYILVWLVFENVPQIAAYDTFRYPVGFLLGLTSNVSIPIVLKWFTQQVTKKLDEAAEKGQ